MPRKTWDHLVNRIENLSSNLVPVPTSYALWTSLDPTYLLKWDSAAMNNQNAQVCLSWLIYHTLEIPLVALRSMKTMSGVTQTIMKPVIAFERTFVIEILLQYTQIVFHYVFDNCPLTLPFQRDDCIAFTKYQIEKFTNVDEFQQILTQLQESAKRIYQTYKNTDITYTIPEDFAHLSPEIHITHENINPAPPAPPGLPAYPLVPPAIPTRPTAPPQPPTRPIAPPQPPTRPIAPTQPTRPTAPPRPPTRPTAPPRPPTRPTAPTQPPTHPSAPTRPPARPTKSGHRP